MKHIFIIFSFFFLVLSPVRASYFRNYQVENGLSNNSVWTIMQDSEGYMWFGTKDGLNRFDGKNFKIYRKLKDEPYSIGHNFIHCVKEDSQKRLLIGTRNGIYLYNRERDNFTPIVLEKDSTQQVNVNDILEDKEGYYWVACHGNGLYKLTPEFVVEKHYMREGEGDVIPINFIWTIVTDDYGNLWLGTAGKGLIHFNKTNEIFTPITNIEGLSSSNQSVYSIFCDTNNTLWIGTYTNGLFKYNYINGEASHYLKNTGSVKSITNYSENELIMGSEKGLIIFNKKEETYKIVRGNQSEDNLTDSSIFSIARDTEGAFWIGTYFSGINYFSPSVNEFMSFNNLSQNTVQKYIISSMQEEKDGNILLSTHNNNIIYRFTPTDKHIEKAFEMDHHNIQCLLRDGDSLYVSFYGRGINVLSLSRGKIIEKIKLNTVEGKSMFKISNGHILFSLEEGGCALRKPDGQIRRIDKLPKVPIVDISEDSAGNLWFITHAYGLYCLNINEIYSNSEVINRHPYIPNQNLNCISCDKDLIWLGTKDQGISLFSQKENRIIRTLDNTNGLPSNIIFSILKDGKGGIWVATEKGIAQIDKKGYTVKVFAYINKEIQNNPFCEMKSSTNTLYFGGTNGFTSLNPDKLMLNEKTPPVVLTGFKVSNKEVLPGKELSPLKNAIGHTTEIVLDHNQSNFSFDFASLSYVFPESNQYAYKLEGFDTEWNYVTTNTAQYMNIPPGKYVFRVKGTNNDGVWNDADTHVIVRIKPPVWQELYMILLYIVLVIAIIIYAIRKSILYINKRNRAKQYKFQMMKEKEMYESKINFFTNIAHEIRTPLSLITAPLENIIRTNEGSEQTKKNLHTIERNTNRLLDLVNQLLDFRKIENDMFMLNIRYQDIIKIVRKVYDQYYQDVQILNIEMNIELPEDTILGFVDSEALYKIISNLISNAIKFTRNRVTVTLKSDSERLFLSVADNGKGIKGDQQEKIFEPFYQIQVAENDNYTNKGSGLGLSLSQSLAKKMGGKISVHSEYGKECIFVLELPIIKKDFNERKEKSELLIETALLDSAETDKITLLIVEDNDELRNFMKDCLSEIYNTLEAENGVNAIEMLEANTVDIIISDILMPKMNGLELCHRLKSDPAYSHLPFILLSAKTDTSTKIDGLKKGADVYIEKPFSTEQLKAQISSIVENRMYLRKNFINSPLQYFKHSADSKESVDFVNRLNSFILKNMSDENFSIDNLSSEFAISRTNFQKKIKGITGLTPNEYIRLVRLNKSAELLATNKYRINEVCMVVGFNSPSYFSKCFYDHFGKLPKDFVQNK